MTKLNQLVALEKGAKTTLEQSFTTAYQTIQNPVVFSGHDRTYQKLNDEDVDLPPEPMLVQTRVPVVLSRVESALAKLIDLAATKDTANTKATADIKVGEVTIATNVNVTTLLYLEKKFSELRLFVTKLPTLDPSTEWTRDVDRDVWKATPVETTKTRKMLRNHVKAAATDKHPAQVDVYSEDVIVGKWTTVKLSGAVPAAQRDTYLARIDLLLAAIRTAREAANMIDVTDASIGNGLLNFVFTA